MNGNTYIKKIKNLFLITLLIFFNVSNYLSGEINCRDNIDFNDLYYSGNILAQNSADKPSDNTSGKINPSTNVTPDNKTIENKNPDSISEKKDSKTNTGLNENESLKPNKEGKKENIEKNVKPAELKKAGIEANKQSIIQPALKDNKIIPAAKPVIINEIKIQGNGLLEIENDDFKYKRIPGITIVKEKRVNENIADTKIPDPKEISGKENEKGLFGFKKSTSDILVKIIFIFIIIGIIILFKFRSKTRADKKIFRRFPGA